MTTGEERPQMGVVSIHIHRSTRKVMRITWFSFFVVIMALLVSQDDASTVVSASHNSGMERGKFIGDRITADDLYSAYQQIQNDYRNKAFSPSQPWKILSKKEGVEVAMLETDDPTCPMVRLKGIIPASVKHCWDFLLLDNWEKNMHKIDPFYDSVKIFGSYTKRGVEMVLARKQMKKLLTFGKRDFVFISVSDLPLDDGTWVSGSVSVVTPAIPRVNGYTRGYQDSIAFYKPLSKDKTEVTIVCRIDLNDSAADGNGGSIPMWLYIKTVGATGARSMISLRRALEEEQEVLELEDKLEHEKEGMRFSVPRQIPVFPHDEDYIHERQREWRDRKEKQERDEERMRFSLPWQVPVLPHDDDETKQARKVRGGENEETKKTILPRVILKRRNSKQATDEKQRNDKDSFSSSTLRGLRFTPPSWFRQKNIKVEAPVDERLSWRTPFHGVFGTLGKKRGSR
jgi:hypothetical protein